jgi:hypothetical protein
MRIVGNKNRDEFASSPEEALRRGALIDSQMALMRLPHPRGVWRGTHAFFNAMDDSRAVALAQRVAEAPRVYPA